MSVLILLMFWQQDVRESSCGKWYVASCTFAKKHQGQSLCQGDGGASFQIPRRSYSQTLQKYYIVYHIYDLAMVSIVIKLR